MMILFVLADGQAILQQVATIGWCLPDIPSGKLTVCY